MIAVFIINNICTLKCKDCITRTPYQKKPQNYPAANIIRDMYAYFDIFTHIPCEHIDFEGGESLLHPDMPLLIEEAFKLINKGYSPQARILTNCTVIPDKRLIDVCKQGPFLFLLDDYGSGLSVHKNTITEILEKEQIPYRIDKYYGEGQYCGGWIDLGDFSHKGEPPEVVLNKTLRCVSSQDPYIRDGKIYLCHSQMTGYAHIPLIKGEYIDITDSSVSMDEKRAYAKRFGTRPIKTCEYCNGFIPDDCIRIPAAKQLDYITDDMKVFGV